MRICRLFINFCFLVGLLMFASFFTAFADQKHMIYFHNSETNINNYALLKMEFDKYLSDFGNFEFQPFSDRETFEKFTVGKENGILIISSWHYYYLKEMFPIEPVLIGVLNGKVTQKKIICAKNDVANMGLLENRRIASSGSEDYTRSCLIQMLGAERKNIVDSLKTLIVPKDIDALMAVGFGMASAALTTESNLIKLMSINPKQYIMLSQLASMETLLPVIAVPKQSDEDVELLPTIIARMGTVPAGRRILKMLGLDGWKKLDEAERMLLKE